MNEIDAILSKGYTKVGLRKEIERLLRDAENKARIDELSYIWYDKKLGLLLAHGTGINDRIQKLSQEGK